MKSIDYLTHNMFKNIIKSENYKFVDKSINYFSKKNSLSVDQAHLWILVGSYVINGQTRKSDMDLLCIVQGDDEPSRLEACFEDIKASITIVPESSLVADGAGRKFGGYFSGKLLNPHITFYGNDTMLELAYISAGKYIGPFAGYLSTKINKRLFSKEEVAAHLATAFIALNPDYDSYLLSYFLNENFERLWPIYCTNSVNCLLKSGHIVKRSGGYEYSDYYKSYEDFNRERVRSAVRHWSFGVYGHGCDYTFPDKYYLNADKKRKRLSPEGKEIGSFQEFILNKSGLDALYF